MQYYAPLQHFIQAQPISFSPMDLKQFNENFNHDNLVTDSTKINRPVYNIRMYWTNFQQPTAHAQIFLEKLL